ncbi:MAG: hypothetical protein LBJ71_02315 [Holosporaceae bacterium]|nr:hypothetical protein [Holosporaceae bacterium]
MKMSSKYVDEIKEESYIFMDGSKRGQRVSFRAYKGENEMKIYFPEAYNAKVEVISEASTAQNRKGLRVIIAPPEHNAETNLEFTSWQFVFKGEWVEVIAPKGCILDQGEFVIVWNQNDIESLWSIEKFYWTFEKVRRMKFEMLMRECGVL